LTIDLAAEGLQEHAAPSRPRWKKVLAALGILAFVFGAAGFGTAVYLTHKFSGNKHFNLSKTFGTMQTLAEATFNPEQAFPNQHRITLLCMGLDRNWTNKDMFYTRNARSDTLMVASLDLDRKAVSVLSVPRDTWVEMPGTHSHAKINDAHSRGGIPYAKKTVEQFLDVPVDYYVVIKQEAIQGAIDHIGGLEVNVEKAMDYDDNWGHLHIHLKPGKQVLNGEQVVGYMRFRHDQEGDFGRMRRQQQVIQLLTARLKNPAIVWRMPELFDVLNEYVQTNLRRDQILALGKMFHHVQPQDLKTATLPGDAYVKDGVAIVDANPKKKERMVDWLLRGDEGAEKGLISVEVVNESGDARLASQVVRSLKGDGFEAWGGAPRTHPAEPRAVTEALDHGALPNAGHCVMEALGVQGPVEKKKPDHPTSHAMVTLLLGKDAATSPLVTAPTDESARTASRPHGLDGDSSQSQTTAHSSPD
jgi:polyisoprenyl-teichoic acid--peptidoglycan teichoic acid transferase